MISDTQSVYTDGVTMKNIWVSTILYGRRAPMVHGLNGPM
jgi:hypothetical protein